MLHSKISPIVTTSGKRLKHWNSLESQYWQRSKLPTMHFQPSLPRLPIPKLEQTCERYLAAQRPLLSDEAFKETRKNVELFQESLGRNLQEILLANDKKNKHTSYICEAWFDMYLKDRKILPINYNPALVFLNDEKREYNDQLVRAANMLISSLRFYKSLKAGFLEPEVFHLNPKKSDTPLFRNVCSKIPSTFSWYAAYLFNAFPLDMSQYSKLFNTTRIPQIGKDTIFCDPTKRHVVVQRKGHFYVFDVLDESGYILPPRKILGALKTILEDNIMPCEHPIGVLTSMERDEWANVRQHFVNIGNKKSINLIDSALFNICLDDSNLDSDLHTMFRSFLHSDGKNRWFDKSLSLIISKDGCAGVNFEHSWGDGVAVLRYFQDLYKDTINNPNVHPDTQAEIESNVVHRLELVFDDKIKEAVSKAANRFKSICDSLEMHTFVYNKLGKSLCKKHGLSPDAIMQLGFQVAYHKLTGKFAASYESCSTAAFKHGRTETIRPCTMAAKACSLAINSQKSCSDEEKLHLIKESSKMHGQLTREAAMGQGFDRHLYALRLLINAREEPQIFADPAYAAINHNIISSSTLSSPSLWGGAFGPVVKDGFGLGYRIENDSIGVLLTSYNNGGDFMEALRKAYQELAVILQTKK